MANQAAWMGGRLAAPCHCGSGKALGACHGGGSLCDCGSGKIARQCHYQGDERGNETGVARRGDLPAENPYDSPDARDDGDFIEDDLA